MPTHPPEPCLYHRLPPAPRFFGREAEREELSRLWLGGHRGVLALVGLGGAGKTALAARFLEGLLALGGPRPGGLFVWSFYQEPDAGLFLGEATRYFGRPDAAAGAKGAGLLHLLAEGLCAGGPHLLVLDGLERVQRQEGGQPFGQVEDPLLRALLTRLAGGLGRTLALVTSRFPLTDLAPFEGRGYRHLDVGGLGPTAAVGLLRARGVVGDDAQLLALVEAYGAHALTLDHLGGVIGQFLGGDPARAPEAPALSAPGSDRQALRLARLLRAYEEHLPPEELALLCRLCLLRRGATEEHLRQLFLCSPGVHARTARQVEEQVRRLAVSGSYPRRSLHLHELADGIREAIEEECCSACLAGPEELFCQEVRQAVEALAELQRQRGDTDVAELARLYADRDLDVPTPQRPLSRRDRERLRGLCARYVDLSTHPLVAGEKMDPALLQALQWQEWDAPSWGGGEDLSTPDVLHAIQTVRRELSHLAFKHHALRRVRELCRLYQEKWSLAGPLARLDGAGLRRVLGALVGRHLVLAESDGSFSVHPAVRDHFHALAGASGQGGWHDVIREQLVSLARRPGKRLPEDPATLDLVEEAVHHALMAGRREEAWSLYQDVLGGVRHLGWKLGEGARGLRVLRQFEPCPDPWGLAWYLRALGELGEAYAHNPVPFFRADVRLLQGRLPEVAAEGDEARAAVASFLMGQTRAVPPTALGLVVPRQQILLYLGRPERVRQTEEVAGLYQDIGLEGDRARCRMFLAEAARRQSDLDACWGYLEAAARWVLHAGSVEHLCLLHLMRARAARSAGDGESAQRAVDDGLHLARQYGLGLYLVELLCEQAEVCLARTDAVAAGEAAESALERARAGACRFAWGAAEAGHLLGQALSAQQRFAEAGAVLEKVLGLRQRLGHPGVKATADLLAWLAGR
jgi:hypothetical protein